MMSVRKIITVMFFVLASGCWAEVLYDFETVQERLDGQWNCTKHDKLIRDKDWASRGDYSLKFFSSSWKDGMNKWPAFNLSLPKDKKDWRNKDYFIFDVVNPTGTAEHLRLFISDSKRPFREGYLSQGFDIKPYSHQRIFIPLSGLPSKIDKSDISVVHFFTQQPKADYVLHIDNLMLLSPQDVPPVISHKLSRELIRLKLEAGAVDFAGAISQCAQAIEYFPKGTPEKKEATRRISKLIKEAVEVYQKIYADNLTIEEFNRLSHRLAMLPLEARRINSELEFALQCETQNVGDQDLAVGFVPAMSQAPPCDVPFEVEVKNQYELSLARGETEAVQIAVLPLNRDISEVTVELADLNDVNGNTFDSKNIEVSVIGFVKTEKAPPYKADYVGWWPRIVMDNIRSTDIRRYNLQTYYIRLRCPRNQQRGIYKGLIKVRSKQSMHAEIPVSVKVYGFELPHKSPLPNAVSFNDDPRLRCGEKWQKMKFVYADFLASYGIDYDSIYRPCGPDYEILENLKSRDMLTAFNLCNISQNILTKDPNEAARLAVERVRPIYAKAAEWGLLKYAYVYGFDECHSDYFAAIEKCAKELKKEFPGIRIMTTAHDPDYGCSGIMGDIDIWCPLLNHYNPKQAAIARKANKKVWWYLSTACDEPYPNVWVESKPLSVRVMMGFMSAKYDIDGFLYYATVIWGKNAPLGSKPFTDWNPMSFGSMHGDGCIIYAGPNYRPLASLSLENFRDGLEDLSYYLILKKCVEYYETQPDNDLKIKCWVKKAKALLAIPEDIVKSTDQYTNSPGKLYHYRNTIGEMIDELDIIPISPRSIVKPL